MSRLRAARSVSVRVAAGGLALCLFGASGVADPPPPTPSPAEESGLERYLSLFDGLGAVVESASGDCESLAAAVDAWRVAHGESLVAAMIALESEPPELDADPALRDAVARRVERTLEALTGATMDCAEHDGASAALERLRRLAAP